jgi:predicted esterase
MAGGRRSAAAGRALPALLTLAAAFAMGLLSTGVSAVGPCVDRPVPGKYTCAQQRRFGKCSAAFMRGYCSRTCARCRPAGPVKPRPCVDLKVPGRFTCAQQKAFGKCGATWMRGYCNKTCKRCKAPTPKRKPAPKPAPQRKPVPKPAPKPKPAGLSPSQLQEKRDSSIPTSALSCRPDGDGGRLCGIPVGYKGFPGRNGYYYLPKTWRTKVLPVMVVLHGAGVNGNWMIQSLPFKQMADKYQLILVAPDSRDDMDWANPRTYKNSFTHDWYHIEACYAWFLKHSGARVDKKRVVVGGNSRAGYTGPAIASRSNVLAANGAIIMHASALPQQMGGRPAFPILWAQGQKDPLYTLARTKKDLAVFKKGAPRFPVIYREFSSHHSLDKSQEIDYMCRWTAEPGFRHAPAPRIGTY